MHHRNILEFMLDTKCTPPPPKKNPKEKTNDIPIKIRRKKKKKKQTKSGLQNLQCTESTIILN